MAISMMRLSNMLVESWIFNAPLWPPGELQGRIVKAGSVLVTESER